MDIPDLATKLQFCGKRNSVLLSNTEPGWTKMVFHVCSSHISLQNLFLVAAASFGVLAQMSHTEDSMLHCLAVRVLMTSWPTLDTVPSEHRSR